MALRETNLVPSDIQTSRFVRRHLSLWAGILAISLALIFGFHFYQTRIVLSKKKPAAKLQDTHAYLSRKIDEINVLQDKIRKIDQQLSIIEAIATKQSYSKIISKLAGVMNEYTWLRQLAVDSGGEKNSPVRLQLSGFSTSNEMLGDFLNQLSTEPMFEKFVLKYSRESIAGGPGQGKVGKKIQFMIECDILKG